MRSTEINYDMCMREHKNVLIEHDKELKRLAYKEDVLRVKMPKEKHQKDYDIMINGIFNLFRDKYWNYKSKSPKRDTL